MLDLINQVATPAIGTAANGYSGQGDSATLALRLLQGEDAGLFIIVDAHALDGKVLENLLSLSQVDLEDGRVLQVLLAGNHPLDAYLDHRSGEATAYQCQVHRWFISPQLPASVETAGFSPYASLPSGRKGGVVEPPPRKSTAAPTQALPQPAPARSFRHVIALGLLLATATATGWYSADRLLTEASVATIEAPVEPARVSPDPVPVSLGPVTPEPLHPDDFLVSTDHGPTPILRSGETIVVRVETSTDKFVYCYYMDSFQQVARIFPNRFQMDAFVPAGQAIEIPPGPERPFNIRMDMAGRDEVISCLASSTPIDGSLIDGAVIDDLTPIPGLGLQNLFEAFGRISGAGIRSQSMPINVVASEDDWLRSDPVALPLRP
jgi:hypothetical protein